MTWSERSLYGSLFVLTVATGLIDAASFLGLGHIFTANMTGNIVFLGFALAGVPGFSWATCTTGLIAFMGGAGIAARIGRAHDSGPQRRWLLTIAAGEAILLWLAAACALFFGASAQLAMVALTAVAMGARNATVRQLKIPDLTTTVLTLTITGVAADSYLAGGSNPNLARRVLAILAILAGALAGALLLKTTSIAVPLAVAGLLVLGVTALLVRDEPLRV